MRDWSAPSKPHVPRASAHMDRRPRAKRNPRIHDPRRQIDTHYAGIIAAVETRHLQRANDGINSDSTDQHARPREPPSDKLANH